MAFKKAERKKVWVKCAITGPSGSGKTMGALLLARGMGENIALIDTENGSGSLYADITDYDVQEISPPYTVQKYVAAIQEAVAAGYDVLIIDSLTHAWAGEGGLLQQKEAADTRGGNQFANWAPITKQHEAFKAAILNSGIHVICTMRSKQEYAQVEKEGGRGTSIKKLGAAPIQREGMDYEFTVVFDVTVDHYAAVTKDRTGLFDGMNQKLTADHGKQIMEWRESGKGDGMTDEQRTKITELSTTAGFPVPADIALYNNEKAETVIAKLERILAQRAAREQAEKVLDKDKEANQEDAEIREREAAGIKEPEPAKTATKPPPSRRMTTTKESEQTAGEKTVGEALEIMGGEVVGTVEMDKAA